MGSFNVVCNVSNVVLTRGQKAALIVVGKNRYPRQEGMLVHNTDEYVPLSLPLIGIYDDYGRFNLAQDAVSVTQNEMAWRLLRPLIDKDGPLTKQMRGGSFKMATDSHKRLQAFDKQDGIDIHDESTAGMEKNIYAFINDYVREQKGDLSVMPIDFNVYQRLVGDSKRKPTHNVAWVSPETEGVNFQDYVSNAIGNILSLGIVEYDRLIETTEQAMAQMTDNLRRPNKIITVPLHSALFDSSYGANFTYEDVIFYQILAGAYKKDKNNMMPFIDAYCLNIILARLCVPYSLRRYGNQTDNNDVILQSVLGTLDTLKESIITDYLDGSELDLASHLHQNDADLREMDEKTIKALIDGLTLKQLEEMMTATANRY